MTLAVSEEARASLARRIGAMHQLWQLGVADLTLDHVNHHERAGVLPIAFTLLHCVTAEDRTAAELLDAGPPLWEANEARIGRVERIPRMGSPIADAERSRIGDLDAWREYQTAVFARTERHLEAIALERLTRPVVRQGSPASLATTFLSMMVGSETPTAFDALEAWVYQHGIRHAGEIEHARALVGLRGVT